MTRKFINQASNVSVIITDNAEGATTVIVGDETKVTDETILSLYNGDTVEGWVNEDDLIRKLEADTFRNRFGPMA